MSAYVSAELRRLVWQRADNRCEYCRLPEFAVAHKHEPDHIIPLQHGGDTSADNLACACFRCNRHKGPNVGSFDPLTGDLVPLFSPRTQTWAEHFERRGAEIRPLTAEARVTVKLLDLNSSSRLREREVLLRAGIEL